MEGSVVAIGGDFQVRGEILQTICMLYKMLDPRQTHQVILLRKVNINSIWNEVEGVR